MENKNNSQFVSLLCNIVIPIIVLTKFSKETSLGPVYGLIAALALPLVYGLYDFIVKKNKNFISILGFVGVLLSGMIGLLKFPPHWVAVKEAAVPLVIGIVVLASTKTSWQLVKKFLYNREMLDVDQIESRLTTSDMRKQRDNLLTRANVFLACSFFFSAVLNYVLAKVMVHSMPGTVEFNEEIGKMAIYSYPVIAVPSMIVMVLILWYIMATLKKLTQLSTTEIFSEKFRDKKE